MNALILGAIVVMTLVGAVASWMLKLASSQRAPLDVLTDWHFWAGGIGYASAALLNIWVLRHLDLSVVLPLTALTYVWTLLIARLFLGEQLTTARVGGVGLIMAGVVFISVF